MRLLEDVEALCALGERRCGTAEGQQAAALIAARFEAVGLRQVHAEPFRFRSFEAVRSRLEVAVGSDRFAQLKHEPLAYCGAGAAEAEVVALGTGEPADYEGRDVTGRVVLVERNATFHRSAQYREAIARGAAGLIYMSHAPQNLIQRGTIGEPLDGLGAIPAVAVGEADGQRLLAAARSGRLRARVMVEAHLAPATGANVLGVLPGESSGVVLVGAHFDSWHAGAADNASGIAALLGIAARRAAHGRPRRTLVFAAWDGEELGLFGGYHWLRQHAVLGQEPLRAFVNLEIPSAGAGDVRALAHSLVPGVEAAISGAALADEYPIAVGMHLVPGLFGGVIPTDIQGHVRRGHPGLCTACDTPWYHTAGDTPDKLDAPLLTSAVERLDEAVQLLLACDDAALAPRDPEVWQLAAQLEPGRARVRVRDGRGAICAGAEVELSVCVDDFTRTYRVAQVTDADGLVTAALPPRGSYIGQRWLHVTAGRAHPLCEEVLPLD
jgi:Zn-dependent M28 family amino/carboxypeptidase